MPMRTQLWDRMIAHLEPEGQVTVFEFGVAKGQVTQWWLAQCQQIVKWYGFDTFQGLPRAWRHFPAGAFGTYGQPPAIADSRVEWVIGRIEETLSDEFIQKISQLNDAQSQRVFILDMDLYEPTKYVLEQIMPLLKKGDMFYLDEAADLDERRAFIEAMESHCLSQELIGTTPIAMALRIIDS